MKSILAAALIAWAGLPTPAARGSAFPPVLVRAGVPSPVGATTAEVTALARNPKSPNELLALKADPSTAQLYISTNGGATWKLRASLPRYASDVAYDPKDPRTIYILCGMLGLDAAGCLFKSTDKGLTFTQLAFPARFGTSRGRIAVHPKDPKIILVACAYWTDTFMLGHSRMAVLRTTDDGATWRATKLLFLSFWGAETQDVVISGQDPNVAYLCGYTKDDSTSTGYSEVYLSKNAGGTWKNVTDLTVFGGQGAFGLALHPKDANRAWVAFAFGVARTADAGAHWTPQAYPGFPYFPTTAVAVDPLNPATLFAGSGRSCYKSTDGGVNWKPHSKNLKGKACLRILARGSQVHFATEAGIFRSADGGLTWKKTL